MERLHVIGHPCASAFAYFHTLPLVTILSLLAARDGDALLWFLLYITPTYRFRIRLATFVEVLQVFSIWSFSSIEGVCSIH